jgi:hypothetical protein
MSQANGPYFDLATVALLREALDNAWAYLTPNQRDQLTRSLLGARVLKAAAEGERDRKRLVEAALGEELAP